MRKKFRQLSLQAKMSSIFVLANLVVFAVTVILLLGINSMSSEIDKVYQGNLRLNEVSDALMAVQDSMTDYLNSKTSDSLEEFYRNEQTYSQLVQDMSDEVTGATFQRMERSIRHMSEEYLDLVSQTIEAKRGRNVEKYRVRYENATQMYEYINTYIYSLNNEQFRSNSENYSRLSAAFRNFEMVSVIALSIVIVVSVSIVVKLTGEIISPLKDLAVTADEVAGGNFDTELLQVQSEDEIGVVTGAFNQMLISIRQYLESLRESMEIRRSLMEKELLMEAHLKDAQLKYLQAQINPHFLYNSLSIINWKAIEADEQEISKVTLALSTYYRTSLNRGETMTTVVSEMENIRAYLKIQLIMHDNSFRVEEVYDNTMGSCEIPKLILQPLVENAIDHGLDVPEKIEKVLRIKVVQDELFLYFMVEDNGNGMTEEKASQIVTYRSKGYGVRNVNERIVLLYGEENKIRVESKEGEGTRVCIRIPKKKENGHEKQETKN
jgi:sensor histidine kinase YesM